MNMKEAFRFFDKITMMYNDDNDDNYGESVIPNIPRPPSHATKHRLLPREAYGS